MAERRHSCHRAARFDRPVPYHEAAGFAVPPEAMKMAVDENSLCGPVRPHYPNDTARRLDLAIHIVGLAFSILGGAAMLAIYAFTDRDQRAVPFAGIVIYAVGLVLMLSFSTAYNFCSERHRSFFRRLDHSGIFLMIAGSYTPFTTGILTGAWAWGMTLAVWIFAGTGIAVKLFRPAFREGLSNALYLGLAWIVVFATGPIVEHLSTAALALLVAGGLIYTLGVFFHVNERLTYSRPIWHSHVLAGAGAHWAAILIGTVLAGR